MKVKTFLLLFRFGVPIHVCSIKVSLKKPTINVKKDENLNKPLRFQIKKRQEVRRYPTGLKALKYILNTGCLTGGLPESLSREKY